MTKAKIYTYKDFTGTLKEIIEYFDLSINYKTLKNRLHKGMAIEEAIETSVDQFTKAKIYTYKDFTGTLKEIIEYFNLDINYKTLQDRLYKGMTIEEAIETPVDQLIKAKIYTYKDFTGTLKEIIERFDLNINYNTLYNRLYNGMTIEEAIETSVGQFTKNKIYTYKDFTGTLKEIIEYFNLDINYKALYNRLHKGMTIEEAIETPIVKIHKAKIYTYNGFTGTLKEIIEYFNLSINYDTIQGRLYKGMTIEEAICKTFYSKEYAQKLKNLCNQYNVDFIELVNKFDEVPYKEDRIIEIIKEL